MKMTDGLPLWDSINAIAKAWDQGTPCDADYRDPAEHPGSLVLAKWGGPRLRPGLGGIYDLIEAECSDGEKVFSFSLLDVTEDEVLNLLRGWPVKCSGPLTEGLENKFN